MGWKDREQSAVSLQLPLPPGGPVAKRIVWGLTVMAIPAAPTPTLPRKGRELNAES